PLLLSCASVSRSLLRQHLLSSSRSRPPPTSTLSPYTTLFRSSLSQGKLFPAVRNQFPHIFSIPLQLQFPVFNVSPDAGELGSGTDRKSTRLNSSHVSISYAVFCLKKKRKSSIDRATESTTSTR